jgi:hypothetical protein
MSADPERLLQSSGADPVERELLASVRNVHAPEGAKDRAWHALAGQLAAGIAVGAAAATSTAAAGTAHGGTLSFVPPFAHKAAGVLLAGGIAAGGYVAFRGSKPVETPKVASSPRAPSPVVVAPPPALEPAVEPPPAPVVPNDAPAKRHQEAERTAALSAESSLLTEARARLRAGDVAGAADTLARAQRRFPRGVLSQEREVLSIEILNARGNAAAARSRALAFVQAHPSSPHSEKLRRLFDVR